VLYISGYAGDVVSHDGEFEPRGTFLRKPFMSEELLRAVRTALAVGS
jgi:hypothetical protein